MTRFRTDGVTVDCGELAREGLGDLTREVEAFRREAGLVPCLALFAGPPPEMESEARAWLALKEQALKPCGFELRPALLAVDSPSGATARTLRALVHDTTVHAVFLQYPFANAEEVEAARSLIAVERDVDAANFDADGWNPGQPTPATALAAVRLIDALAPTGEVLVFTGLGPVGPAVCALLRSSGREVSAIEANPVSERDWLDSGSGVLQSAAAVVAACGRPSAIDARTIPDGAVVIDAGYDLPGGKGEIRLSEAEPARWRAFVPPRGGLGPLTVLELGRATLAAARWATRNQKGAPGS